MGIGSGIVHDSDPEAEWQECLLKGHFLTKPTPKFQIIETILWESEKGFFLLDLHLQRLAQSAAYFNFPSNAQLLRAELERQAASWSLPQDQVPPKQAEAGKEVEAAKRVRVLLHRNGRFSISAVPCERPQTTGLPVQQKCSEIRKVTIAKQRMDSTMVQLFHKTTNREIYDLELSRARKDGFSEVFFLNEKGEMTEGAISNIVIRTGERYFTPPVSCGLLPGTFRAHLLNNYPRLIQEKAFTLEEMAAADHIYMINSVRGFVKVKLDKAELSSSSPHLHPNL
jgi:para-aminobenzoate synthetase/4-amino-4-deoxychorismate lyase